MDADYEVSRQNLEKLIRWYEDRKGQRNEATTRLQLVDALFFECLAWSKDDVVLEESYAGEYTDYTFSAPRRILIVEAKKEGDYFELPIGKSKTQYSLPPLLRDYPNLKAAIGQAVGYCQTRGVPFGAVCNGHQIVAFIAARSDGNPPLEGRALVFHSLEFMLEHFQELWDALSKPAVEKKQLQNLLIGDSLPELPPKLSTFAQAYPGVKQRNIFQVDLQNLSELIIEDLINSSELRESFLEECYSKSGALSQYAMVSKNILEARYAALFGSEAPGPTLIPAVDKKGISAELLAESFSRRPVLLVGDVGVGKTMFIRHLVHIEASPTFTKAITIYIDLGFQATLSYDLKDFVLEETARQLLNDFQVDIFERNFVYGVYHSEIKRFGDGIYSDIKDSNPTLYKQKEIEFVEEQIKNKEQHLKKVFQHISKARKKQIVIFIDNADQRDEATQQQAFLISQEIAANWRPVTVFVALRPETFYRSLKIGALSGYHPKAFTISPPRIDRVIEKRLNFALKLTSGEIPIESLPFDVNINLHNLGKLITILIRSLERNEQLGELIDNVAGGNVRLALDLVRGFLGSGHVDTVKILEAEEESKNYIIPLHEFLRAVIYGDAEHYAPDQSPVANLFDLSFPDPKEHFLMPLVLGVLEASSSASIEEGFVDTTVLYERLQRLGFTPAQIDSSIIAAHKKKLLESATRRIPQPGVEMPQMLRPTTIGIYHIRQLAKFFTYIDAVLVDTPILDSKARVLIHNEVLIKPRLERAMIFRRYLDEQWQSLDKTEAKVAFDWTVLSRQLEKEIENIKERMRRR